MLKLKRLFVAVPLSDELIKITNQFVEQNQHLKEVRWTKEKNRHVTICFLGNQDEKNIPIIIDKIRGLHKSLMPVVLANPELYLAPNIKKPIMIWAKFDKRDCFNRLVTGFSRNLLNTSPKFEPVPHITMSRLKEPVSNLVGGNKKIDYYEEYTKIVLYESILKPEGAEYIELEVFE
ncbi:MAG: RNA 2',3'-cyclic phosphodiesterase [Bacteroidales bacterium]|nr:RNA 2',3'-cyclic phosphodiesterase [Bacteroidales bacterium]